MDSDDDEMADLFSFGADSAPPSNEGSAVSTPTTAASTAESKEKTATATASSGETSEMDGLLHDSDDSFLKMLDEHPVLSNGTGAGDDGTKQDAAMNDQETQDILNWLEEDDTDADALLAAVADESVQNTEAMTKKENQEKETTTTDSAAPAPAPPPPPAPTFASLEEALKSKEATKLQILEQWEQEANCTLKNATLRPLLWSRVIANRNVDDLVTSSLADSFQEYSEHHTTKHDNPELDSWIRTESAKLAPRIVRTNPSGMTVNDAEEALQEILFYHYHSNSNTHQNGTDNSQSTGTVQKDEASQKGSSAFSPDPLLPPVVSAILGAGVPKLATPVLISYVIPSFMPFVALTPDERWEASKLLHSQFYLLATYHLPMLCYHLDRYVPGWYWPQRPKAIFDSGLDEKENQANDSTTTLKKSRHAKEHGVIPPSWLMTHLAGECGGTFLDPNRLLQLLDLVFTNENNSLRFFLVLAVLEQHSDSWLELTGDALMNSLLQNMQDSSAMTMEEWAARARAMKQATPDSVVDRLRTAEDDAVRQALKERQKRAEAALKARLEAEAAAHREAQERKAEEARIRLTRARLVAYYRRWNPSKEGNVDKIMETYKDNFEELDKKLKKKYGVGFNPALNPNKKKKTMTEAANESMKRTMQSMNETMVSMNEGIKRISVSSKTNRKDNPLEDDEETDEIRIKEQRVSVSVKVGETLPFICMTKEQANDIRRTCLQKDLPMPLRFYLVDSRSEETAEQQGRFPTAARLSPETLMDPDALQLYEESFEAVRGSVHICVMGEGYSAIPELYNHRKLTPELEECMRQDESRTNNCALFFVKRGFPFVSVLEGGFAAAHAWLVREGPKKNFDVKALLSDYDPEVSLFGQMEKIRMDQKLSAGYKTQRAMQNLLESSMTAIVRGKMHLEGSLAAEVEVAAAAETKTPPKSQGAIAMLAQAQRNTSEEKTVTTGFSSFFNRRQQVAAAVKPASNGDESSADNKQEGGKEQPLGYAVEPAQPQNRFTKWRQAAASAVTQPQASSQPVTNRFGGFGMRRGTSQDSTDNKQPMLKRNPFARFGGATAVATTNSGGFGGFMKSVNSSTANTQSQQQQASPTIVSLPPRKASTDSGKEGSQGESAIPNKPKQPKINTV